jgi:hypothetical protein
MDGALSTVLQSSTVERHSGLATGFGFTEGRCDMPMAFRLASIFAIAGFCVGRQGRESRWCGSIYFTAPGMRMALEGRNVESSPVSALPPTAAG